MHGADALTSPFRTAPPPCPRSRMAGRPARPPAPGISPRRRRPPLLRDGVSLSVNTSARPGTRTRVARGHAPVKPYGTQADAEWTRDLSAVTVERCVDAPVVLVAQRPQPGAGIERVARQHEVDGGACLPGHCRHVADAGGDMPRVSIGRICVADGVLLRIADAAEYVDDSGGCHSRVAGGEGIMKRPGRSYAGRPHPAVSAAGSLRCDAQCMPRMRAASGTIAKNMRIPSTSGVVAIRIMARRSNLRFM